MSVTVVPPTDGTKEVVDNVVELGKTLPSSSYKNRLFCIYLSVSPMPFFVYHSLTLGISSLHCTSLWHPHLSLSPQQFSVVASGKPFSRTGGGSNGGEHSLSVRVYPNGVCVCTKLYCLLLPKRFLAVLSLSLSPSLALPLLLYSNIVKCSFPTYPTKQTEPFQCCCSVNAPVLC